MVRNLKAWKLILKEENNIFLFQFYKAVLYGAAFFLE